MNDNLSIPFTVIKQIDEKSVSDKNEQYHWQTSYENNKLCINAENIKLTQTPSETLNMRVEITKEKDKQNGASAFAIAGHRFSYTYVHHHRCNIELRFPNYLHEFNQSYMYDVICTIEKTNQHGDQYLFNCSMNRLSECIKFDIQYVALTSQDLLCSSERLYFYIRRRFNGNNNMVDDERVHRVLSTLRNSGCDVVLAAKDGDVRAHKSILSLNSQVFQSMFSVEMKEKQSGIIDVSDFEKSVIKTMLDYLYTGEIGKLGDMAESLFKLAHRYELHDLCRRCEEYYIFNVKVDNDNIVEILKLSDLYELKKLYECAVNFAKCHEQELSAVSGYREYLIQSTNLDNTVTRLLLADKYDMKDVKMKTFDFIKNNYLKMMKNQDFLSLFESKGRLMKEIHVYVHQN